MRKTVSILLLLVAGVAAIALPFTGIEPGNAAPVSINSVVFQPSRYPAGDWKPVDLDYQDVYFVSSDRTPLHGWYCPVTDSRHTVLYVHGNAGNIATRVKTLRRMQQVSRVSVLAFDYRGYGRSSGTPDVEGAIRDAEAARAELRKLSGASDGEIVVWGESVGGVIAVELADASPPKALILESTFSSLRDMAQAHYPQHAAAVPSGMLNATNKIRNYRGKLLQLHGGADRIVPVYIARRLHDAAKCEKQFVLIAGKGHNNLHGAVYHQNVDDFLTQLDTHSD